MTAESFASGQRWLSNNEPELGLGLVISASRGRVAIHFPATGQTRQYTASNAPLTRISFSEGDEVRGHDGTAFLVEQVTSEKNVLIYHGAGKSLPESALADSLNFSRPLDRLLHAQLDDKGLFNLRSKCLHHRFETLRGHQRGFVGARIELIPHQLFTALQIRRKGVPRLVLADESGLGKTIEVCLVLHRLLVTNRIERALIVVPEHGLHRWHFELTRRFHLQIAAPELDRSSESSADLWLCSPAALARYAVQSWDLLIVDEADSVDVPGLKELCAATAGVVLMTDLPPQIERETHSRLGRLLDENESHTLADPDAVRLAVKLAGAALEPWLEEDRQALERLIGSEVDASALGAEAHEGRDRLLAALLETVGAGRRLLANSRAIIEGLPEREALPQKLTVSNEDATLLSLLAEEFSPDGLPNPAFALPPDDPRLSWLRRYVDENPKDKIVLICATQHKAAAIAGALGEKAALHHEGLDLLTQDHAVHRFAEKDERSAHVLVCSEGGIEARSLPFAHHIVLFDLPPDPVKVQKRIGNLDRYGHMAKVRVHIPYVENTPSEVIFRWFHEALHLFERPLAIVHACSRAFAAAFREAARLPRAAEETVALLLEEARNHSFDLKAQLESRGDPMTALASFRLLPAQKLLESVRRLDSDLSLDFLMLRLFDHFGFDAEDVGERTYHVRPREKDRESAAFSSIGPPGQSLTFERQKALARDDLWFLTWDHPIVLDHVELLLKTTQGNSCYAVWEDLRSQILLLEGLFRVELANPPKKLYPTRFFSPAGLRLIVNHELAEVGTEYPMEIINKNVRNGRREWIRSNNDALRGLLPRMLENLTERARACAAELSQQALLDIDTQFVPEIERLKLLKQRRGPVSEMEVSLLESEMSALRELVQHPRIKLDSLRLVRRGPAGKGI
ncbi:MAG: RNA polymerase-associated protein RapA [Verrucomicrobiales bacterium]